MELVFCDQAIELVLVLVFGMDLPGGSVVKNLPAMQEIQVQSLSQEDPLEKGMATHSGILAWRIPWTEEPAELCRMGSKESDMTEQHKQTHRKLYLISCNNL